MRVARLLLPLLALLLSTGCGDFKDSDQVEYDWSLYDYEADPLANFDFAYNVAGFELGVNNYFVALTGVQHGGAASTGYTLDWTWSFLNPVTGRQTTIATVPQTVETVRSGVMPSDREVLSRADGRWTGLIPVEQAWTSCVESHGEALLLAEVYVPLLGTYGENQLAYRFATTDGETTWGATAFLYDATTGADITPAVP
ncbi:MAG: hypothetical protein QM767_29140 [Anaeromyxobacter sp.]